MRYTGVIALEGVLTGDGRLILPGALTWDDEHLAVVVIRDEDPLVGVAHSIQRVGREIHAVVDLEGYWPENELPCGVELICLALAPASGGVMVVDSAQIGRLTLYAAQADAAWPEARLTRVQP